MDFLNKSLSYVASTANQDSWHVSLTNPTTSLIPIFYKSVFGSDGSVYCVGKVNPRNASISKFDSDGNHIWTNVIVESYSLFTLQPKAIAHSSGITYAAIYIQNGVGTLIVAINENGVILSQVRIYKGVSRFVEIKSMQVAGSELILFGTYRDTGLTPQYRAMVTVLDTANLNVINRQKQYVGSSDVVVNDGAYTYDASGGYCMMCGSHGNNVLLFQINPTTLAINWSNATDFNGGVDVANKLICYNKGSGGATTMHGFVVGNSYNTSTSKNDGFIYQFDVNNIGSTYRHISHANGVNFNSGYFFSSLSGYFINVVGAIQDSTPYGLAIEYEESSFYTKGKTFVKSANYFIDAIAGPSLNSALTTSENIFKARIDDNIVSPNWGGYNMSASSLSDASVSVTNTSSVLSESDLALVCVAGTYGTSLDTASKNITYNYSNKAV